MRPTPTCHKASAAMALILFAAGFSPDMVTAMDATASGRVMCPPEIRTTQKLTGRARPWQSIQLGASNKLVYMEVYDGPPRQEQIIMADEHKDEPGQETMLWRFHGQPAREGTWLLCSYQNTQVKLQLRLPETVTECFQTDSTDPNRVIKLVGHGCR